MRRFTWLLLLFLLCGSGPALAAESVLLSLVSGIGFVERKGYDVVMVSSS